MGSLPLPLYATRGTNVAGVFYLAGGYVGEIHKHKCRLRLGNVMAKLLIVATIPFFHRSKLHTLRVLLGWCG